MYSLIRRDEYEPPDSSPARGLRHDFYSKDIVLDGREWMNLHQRNVFVRCGMVDNVGRVLAHQLIDLCPIHDVAND